MIDKLARALAADLGADRAALAHHRERVDEALQRAPWPPGDPLLSVVAVAAHHYYTACEAIFERVASAGFQPPSIRPATRDGLRELAAFRHFFRHAYATDFQPGRLAELAQVLLVTHDRLDADLDGFVALLTASQR